MAKGLKIVGNTLTGDINLYDGTAKVIANWMPSPYEDGKLVAEAIPLLIQGTATACQAQVDDIDDALAEAPRFVNDPRFKDPVQLVLIADTNYEQRSVIYGGHLELDYSIGSSAFLETGWVTATLHLKRHPAWEPDTRNTVSMSDKSVWGGVYSWTGVVGNLGARLSETEFAGSLGNGPFYDFWIGFRREREGLTQFDPILEAEDGSIAEPTYTTVVTEAGTSGGSVVETDFSNDATLIRRFYIVLKDACPDSNYTEHYVGKYLILARAKMTGTGKAGVQLRMGYKLTDETSLTWNYVVEVEGTSYMLYPLGYAELPPHAVWEDFGNDLAEYAFHIYAEKLTGSSKLRIDAIGLVPLDASLITSGGDVDTSRTLSSFVRADDRAAAVAYATIPSTVPDLSVNAAFDNWELPYGDSKMVIFAQQATVHEIDEVVDVTIKYYPRWRSYART